MKVRIHLSLIQLLQLPYPTVRAGTQLIKGPRVQTEQSLRLGPS